MVDGVKQIYEILGWDKEAKAILAVALKSADAEAKTAAAALINRLDARGLSGFRELLDDWHSPAKPCVTPVRWQVVLRILAAASLHMAGKFGQF